MHQILLLLKLLILFIFLIKFFCSVGIHLKELKFSIFILKVEKVRLVDP
jgi:hypothetical protein